MARLKQSFNNSNSSNASRQWRDDRTSEAIERVLLLVRGRSILMRRNLPKRESNRNDKRRRDFGEHALHLGRRHHFDKRVCAFRLYFKMRNRRFDNPFHACSVSGKFKLLHPPASFSVIKRKNAVDIKKKRIDKRGDHRRYLTLLNAIGESNLLLHFFGTLTRNAESPLERARPFVRPPPGIFWDAQVSPFCGP